MFRFSNIMPLELQTQTRLTNNLVARFMNHAYTDGTFEFSRQEQPNQFAHSFLDTLHQNGIGNSQEDAPIVAVLGSGNGRDDYLFAQHGFEVIAFELNQTARDNILSRFSQGGLENRLTVMENFFNNDDLKPRSLDAVYAVSSVHYFNPLQLHELLSIYCGLLRDTGLAALALKTRNASWYREFREHGLNPQERFDVSDLIKPSFIEDCKVYGYHHELSQEPKGSASIYLTRWYYTIPQLEAIAKASGFKVEASKPWQVENYDRHGKTEEFAYLVLKPIRGAAQK